MDEELDVEDDIDPDELLEDLEGGYGEPEYWDDETVAQKQAYMIERIKQEEKDAQERIDELAASLTLLEKIEKRQLITEDQFRATERLMDVISRRLDVDYSEVVEAGLGGAAVKRVARRGRPGKTQPRTAQRSRQHAGAEARPRHQAPGDRRSVYRQQSAS